MAGIALGPFTVQRPLGKGGMGEVWLGRHERTGTEVAIKVMTAENLRHESFQRAFSAEVRAVASLDHPNIIRLYDVATVAESVARASAGRLAAGSPYLVMEYAGGGNLKDDPPGQDWHTVRGVLLTLLSALAHAHARGVIHRDIKPGNVLWGRPHEPGGPRRAILTDFGIAHAGDGGVSGAPTWGTPAYMAPERFTLEWRDLGPWTDLYSVGCLAFSLLRGRPPFKGQPLAQAMQAHLYRPVPSMRAPCPVPPGLDGWLRSMLAKGPDDRFRSAADAAHALRALGEPVGRSHGRAQALQAELSSDTEPTRPSRAPPPGSGPSKGRSDRRLEALHTVHTAEATWTDDTFDPAALSRGSLRARTQGNRHRRRRRPIPPHPVDWRAAAPVGLPADIPGGGLRLFGLRVVRMVDRDAERDLLWDMLGAVRKKGRPRGVLLRGRVGTGKSRLAEWLCEHAAELGAGLPLRADHGVGVGVPALARTVAGHLRVSGLGPRALRSRVLGWLQAHGVHDEWLARELVAVASLGAGVHAEREAVPRDLRGTLRRFLTLLARERPVVLHLDDVAWGPTSLSFAVDLLEQERRLPVMLVLTTREEALAAQPIAESTLAGLVEDGLLTEIDVRPLPAPHRIELVQNLLGVEETLGQRVAERTAGNPLFTVTLVRDWVARGVLTEGTAGLSATSEAELALPANLRDVWANRLAALLGPVDSPARHALELAAALGEAVDDDEWRGACRQAEVDLPGDLLDRLLAERLAARSAGGWRFVHDAVRESVAQTASEQGRLVAAHAACARMLEARHPDPSPLTRERIGRHLGAAGRHADAVPALMAGARARLVQGDTPASLLVLGEAEAMIGKLERPEAARPRVDAHLLHAEILLDQGSPSSAETYARQAERETATKADLPTWRATRAHALLILASIGVLDGLPAEASRHLAEARSLLGDEAELTDIGALARLTGELLRIQGELELAEESLAEAAELYGALQRDVDWARCVVGLASIATDRGATDHAASLLGSALERFRALRHRGGEADALRVGGHAALVKGDLVLADQRFRKSQAIYQRIGSRKVRGCRLGRARVAVSLGRLDEATRLLDAVRADRPRSRITQARVAAVSLLLAAHRADWSAFDATLDTLAGLILRTGLGLAELHQLADEAARAAGAQGQAGRAARARAMLGG